MVSSQVKNAYRGIIRAGVNSEMSDDKARCITLTNFLCLLFAVTLVIYTLAFLAFGYPLIALYSTFFVFVILPWPYFNHIGYTYVARLGLAFSSNVFGLFLCLLLGPHSQFHTGYLCLVGLSVLIFEHEDLKSKIAGYFCFLLTLVCYLLTRLPIMIETFEVLPQDEVADRLQLVAMPVYIGVIFFELLYLQQLNKQISRKLNGSNAELTAQILETKSANEQKDQALVALVASSKLATLGEMAGGVAHEINTPLAVISARVRHVQKALLQDPVDSKIALQYMNTISDTVARIARIVQGLRTFSREGEGDPFVSVKVLKIITDTLSLCQERMHNDGVEVIVSPFSAELECECREIQISQVLLNLLNNGRDAIESLDRKWICISVVEREDDFDLMVTDSGNGVPEAVRDKMMNPFFTTKELGKGTGLGLSISKGIVDRHRGLLMIDSSNANTRFIIRLPKKQKKAAALPSPAA